LERIKHRCFYKVYPRKDTYKLMALFTSSHRHQQDKSRIKTRFHRENDRTTKNRVNAIKLDDHKLAVTSYEYV